MTTFDDVVGTVTSGDACPVPWKTHHLLGTCGWRQSTKCEICASFPLHRRSCRAPSTGLHIPAPTQSRSSLVLGLHFLSPRTSRSLLCHLPRTISLLSLALPNQHHNKRPQSSTTAHYQHYCLIRTDILDVRQFERIFFEQLFCLQAGRQRRRQRPSTR